MQVVCWLFLARCSLKIILARSSKRRGGTVGQSEATPLLFPLFINIAAVQTLEQQAEQAAGQLQEADALTLSIFMTFHL